MSFRNQSAFDDPRSLQMARGVDLRPERAITDAHGHVLAYAQTGGMISPQRHEVQPGAKLFRFGNLEAGWARVAGGGWWIDDAGFARLFAFAQSHEMSIGMAMRLLCLVPPEWSKATLLVRARTTRPLLAWRGLGNSVVIAQGGKTVVRMPHQNEIGERRLHQLFIPGLGEPGVDAIRVEQDYPLDEAAGKRGFLYL
jgi:hypothetical protein